VVRHCYSEAFATLRRDKFLIVHESIQAAHDRFGLAQNPFTSRGAFIGAVGTDKG
jgi:hypothetical protein